MNYLDEITFGIKTFKRPEAVGRLIDSILKMYPTANILVVDDSGDDINQPIKDMFPSTNWITKPLNIGLSAGRNVLVDNTETPYLFLMDDDYIFNKTINIEEIYNKLIELDLDLLAGTVSDIYGNDLRPRNYHGTFEIKNDILHVRKNHFDVEWDSEVMKIDFAMNLFLAKTETLKDVRWEEKLKLAEHLEWYLRYSQKYKLGKFKLPKFNISHDNSVGNIEYRKYRNNNNGLTTQELYSIERECMGVKEIWFDGKFHH